MILADENIFRALIIALCDNGHGVFSVFEECRGIRDVSISQLFLNPERIILTEDKDVGNLVFEKKIQATGVIFLRFLQDERTLIINEVLNFLSTRSLETLKGNFITITPHKVRIKKIPDV